MSNLDFSVLFARRMRHADGLHPSVREVLYRNGHLVVLGAALPILPTLQRGEQGFFKRIFGRGQDDTRRWVRALNEPSGRQRLILGLLDQNTDARLGALSRLALAAGAIAAEISDCAVAGGPWESEDGAELLRAHTRVWLRMALTKPDAARAEWAPASQFEDLARHRRVLFHVTSALGAVAGEAPERQLVRRWMKLLTAEASARLRQDGWPATALTDDAARATQFSGPAGFIGRLQNAMDRFVTVMNAAAERLGAGQDEVTVLHDVLFGSDGRLLQAGPPPSDAERQQWTAALDVERTQSYARGRNAFSAVQNLVNAAQKSAGPLATQEVSLEQIEHAVGAAAPAVPVSRPPTMTQEISLEAVEAQFAAQREDAAEIDVDLIEEVADVSGAHPAVPPAPMTQELSLADVEAGLGNPPPAPMTQELSLADIQAVTSGQLGPGIPPPAPMTQELSLADLQAAMAAQAAPAAAPSNAQVPPAPMTQELSLADLQAAMAGQTPAGAPPPAPMTQELSLADLQAAMAGQTPASVPPPVPAAVPPPAPLTPALPVHAVPAAADTQRTGTAPGMPAVPRTSTDPDMPAIPFTDEQGPPALPVPPAPQTADVPVAPAAQAAPSVPALSPAPPPVLAVPPTPAPMTEAMPVAPAGPGAGVPPGGPVFPSVTGGPVLTGPTLGGPTLGGPTLGAPLPPGPAPHTEAMPAAPSLSKWNATPAPMPAVDPSAVPVIPAPALPPSPAPHTEAMPAAPGLSSWAAPALGVSVPGVSVPGRAAPEAPAPAPQAAPPSAPDTAAASASWSASGPVAIDGPLVELGGTVEAPEANATPMSLDMRLAAQEGDGH